MSKFANYAWMLAQWTKESQRLQENLAKVRRGFEIQQAHYQCHSGEWTFNGVRLIAEMNGQIRET